MLLHFELFYEGCMLSNFKLAAIKISALTLSITFTTHPAIGSDFLPKGRDYPVDSIYTGMPALKVDRSDKFTNEYRTRFRKALNNPVTFAGEYIQTSWGCGSSGCHVEAFINKRTGKALSRAFMVEYVDDNGNSFGEDILYMKKNSRLLVTYEKSDEKGKSYYNYYELKNGELHLIRRQLDVNAD
ncbi:hypothetical protein [Lelliottia wanjuensis]|uniref:hypothetical protein n=1 Tax=Lelliottia wanjuensis TaxID=3050585 RepID=UPI00254A31E1|nr:hypothetical protein [Lelliottia sp. V104_15]MDK9605829.1 hypothetical protein [Lelliottia sp. V104_15]